MSSSQNMTKLAQTAKALREKQSEVGSDESQEKQAIVGQTVGRGIDWAARTGGRALGGLFSRGMAHPRNSVKALTGAGFGLGGAALNEGMAASGLPHIGGGGPTMGTNFGAQDDHWWSPAEQNLRTRTANSRGPLSGIAQMATRPIQSAMQAMGWTDEGQQGDHIRGVDKGDAGTNMTKFDPVTGRASYEFTGGGQGQMSPAYMQRLQQIQKDMAWLKAMGMNVNGMPVSGRGRGPSPDGSDGVIFDYERRPRNLSSSSVF